MLQLFMDPFKFITFMHRMYTVDAFDGKEHVLLGWLWIQSLLFADGVTLSTLLNQDLQQLLDRFAARMNISTFKSDVMILNRKKADCQLELGNDLLPQVKEFKTLQVLFTSGGKT